MPVLKTSLFSQIAVDALAFDTLQGPHTVCTHSQLGSALVRQMCQQQPSMQSIFWLQNGAAVNALTPCTQARHALIFLSKKAKLTCRRLHLMLAARCCSRTRSMALCASRRQRNERTPVNYVAKCQHICVSAPWPAPARMHFVHSSAPRQINDVAICSWHLRQANTCVYEIHECAACRRAQARLRYSDVRPIWHKQQRSTAKP